MSSVLVFLRPPVCQPLNLSVLWPVPVGGERRSVVVEREEPAAGEGGLWPRC